MSRRRRRRGFTLMEVLLVLAILVILGSLVTVSYINIQRSSNVSAAKTQLSLLEQALETYRLNVGSFPSSQQGLEALLVPPPDLRDPTKWAGPYLEKEVPGDPWNNPYQYELLGPDQIRLWSWGPDGADGTADDVQNL